MRAPVLGLVVNPLAGLGGAVGLKGSDGELAARARALGAEPVAEQRAARLLRQLAGWAPRPALVTCAGEMGERLAAAAGFVPRIAHVPSGELSSAADTRAAVRAFARLPVDLLLFVGGDGTARDVLAALSAPLEDGANPVLAVLGVPAGVKMHSGVFATGPSAAAEVVQRWWSTGCGLEEAEVVDREPAADGSPSGPVRLYGLLRVPRVRERVQRAKAQGADADALLDGACERVAALARDERVTLLGPGSTLQRIKERLGVAGTLLGVDAVRLGVPLALDAGERRLLELVAGRPSRIVVTAIGGQGFVFGRGNQPLSAAVIRAVGLENVLIVASASKLAALPGGALYVDTGDPLLDRALAGHRAVVTGAQRQAICRVRAADG